MKRIAAAAALTTGLGLSGVAAASVAEALPGPVGPMPDYHWCPGQNWDQGWGNNWDWGRCHDDFYGDNDPHDRDHWHGQGDWRPDNDQGWNNDRDHNQGWDNDRDHNQSWDNDRDHNNGPGNWQPNGGPGPGPVGPGGQPNGGPGPGPWVPSGGQGDHGGGDGHGGH